MTEVLALGFNEVVVLPCAHEAGQDPDVFFEAVGGDQMVGGAALGGILGGV